MRRKRSKTHQAASLPRTDHRIEEHESDSYGLRKKLPDPTACPSCGAMYRAGRWTWGTPPVDSYETLCSACRRVQDDCPAGIVVVEGPFAMAHREEILRLARNLETREKEEHPLKRIIRTAESADGRLEITTTDARLARAIGDALYHAYRGELEHPPVEPGNLLRVYWKR